MTGESIAIDPAPPRPMLSSRAGDWLAKHAGVLVWIGLVAATKLVLPPDWAGSLSALAVAMVVAKSARGVARDRPVAHEILRRMCGATILILVAIPGAWRDPLLGSFWAALPLGIILMHIAVGSYRGAVRARAVTYDLRGKLSAFLTCILPERLGDFAATDINLLTYVVPGLRRRDVPPGFVGFDYHRQLRPILVVFISLAVIEAVAVHLLLIHAGPIVRWTVFVISDLGLLYFLALAASLSKLPLLIGERVLRVRAGIFIAIDIPIDAIASVHLLSPTEPRRPGTLNATLMSQPRVMIEFRRELPASIPLKGVIGVRRAGVSPDDPAAFIAAVEAALAGQHAENGRRPETVLS